MSTDLFTLVDSIARKEQELDTLRRQLAHLHGCTRLPSGELTVLRCRLNGYALALPVAEISEVVRMAELTVLPNAFAWILGLVTLGTERIPVVDLLGGEAGVRRAPDPDDFIVLAVAQNGPVGLVMDAIDGLFTFEGSTLCRPQAEVPFGAHVLGVFDAGGEAVLLVSAEPISGYDVANAASEASP